MDKLQPYLDKIKAFFTSLFSKIKNKTANIDPDQMKSKIKLPYIIIAVLIVIVLAYCAGIKHTITLNGNSEVTIQCGSDFDDPGATTTTKLPFMSKTTKVVKSDSSYDEVGDLTATYSVGFGPWKKTVTREIHVIDTLPPTLVLNYDKDYVMEQGDEYKEEGYTAKDNDGKDVTVTSEIIGDIVYYTATDSSGNVTKAQRHLPYADTTAPVITLTGGSNVNVILGKKFTEPGYSATDNQDGDLTKKVVMTSNVDTTTLGTYLITYTVSDSKGNVAIAKRTVTVSKLPQNPDQITDPNKVIYLTFDDGPGPYTEKLLDILKKYNVKVTFFVTNQYTDYISVIKREYEEGHTVAIHSYTHNYGVIYANETNFFNDITQMQNVIKEQTGGYTSMILRFPGGSSNTISKNYSLGIMTKLVADVNAKGYTYFDWNVSSGDAGETQDTQQVIANVEGGILQTTNSVVLQHDIKEYSVNAVESIIVWGLENGYTFMPLTASSPQCHHGVNN